MRHLRTVHLFAAVFAAFALTSCGGDNLKGFRSESTPLVITGTGISEPANGTDTNTLFESADAIDFPIPVTGGCGGPYVLSILSGVLPDGVGLSDSVTVPGSALHNLTGDILEAGHFAFRLQVVDKGCDPFLSTYADFEWDVAVGDLQIVGATIQGNNAFFPKGTYVKNGVVQNPDFPAIKSVVYNSFSVVDITVAGGVGPYSAQIVDDPSTNKDGGLPTGTLFPAASASIVGSPVPPSDQVADPFVFTIEAIDSQGRTARMTVQWQIDVPPIIIANTSLPDGKCGLGYGETIVIVDGVPPFTFELVETDVSRNGLGEAIVDYTTFPPLPTPVTAGTRVTAAHYPAQDLFGPDYRAFPVPAEGMYLGDINTSYSSTGTMSGIPRRRGQFRVNFHVASTLLANVKGQQAWRTYEFQVLDSEPPDLGKSAFGQNPAYTNQGVFTTAQPYSDIAEAVAGVAYNPDALTHPADGLLFRARGGVSKDGLTDSPHASQIVNIDGLLSTQENPGAYDWALNADPSGDGDGFAGLPFGMAFDSWLGVLYAPKPAVLSRQGTQAFEATVTDEQLPTQTAHTDIQRVNFSIGPDRVVITQSDTPDATTNYGYWSMNDHAQRVRMLEPLTAGSIIRDLQVADGSGYPTLPGQVPSDTGLAADKLGQLLSGLNDAGTAVNANRLNDLLRVTVNPTWWADDTYGLCPLGARMQQNADMGKGYNYSGNGYYSIGNGSASWVPNATCVELQRCTTPDVVVSHDPLNGRYKDGGKLYAFTSQQYFGVFIVRNDGSITVPAAFDRSKYGGFGDAWTYAYGGGQNSYLKMPQITVSPDGRLAAMKLKVSETSVFDTANSTPILLFTLTGERIFSGKTYKTITTGSSGGSTTGGLYLYAPSLTLTNSHLYYICGNYSTGYESAWHGHFLYRYKVVEPATLLVPASPTTAGGLLTTNPSFPDAANWTQTASSPMQTPFHHWENPGSSTLNQDMYGYDCSNNIENSNARMPWRVSQNGRAIAIIAAQDPGSVTNTTVMSHWLWVDIDGVGVRRLQATSPVTPRRRLLGGAGRGYALTYGALSAYPNFGRYTGPSTCLEISDDGTRVAAVCNRYTSSVAVSTAPWYAAREDIIVYKTSNAWASMTEIFVTGDDIGSSRVFGTNALWRFGALAFTREAGNNGLVFWGGCSSFYANSATNVYQASEQQTGTIYTCNISGATGGTTGVSVNSVLTTSEGGNSVGISSSAYTSSSQYNPSGLAAGTYTATAGVLKPVGGFRSANGNFMYLDNSGALNSSDYTNHKLIGINVSNSTTAGNINGKTNFRAFAVGNWPSQRGFVPGYYGIYPYYEQFYYKYAYGGFNQGGGLQVVAPSTGIVFFADHWQYSSGNYTASYSYGGHIYVTGYVDYGSFAGQVHCFNGNLGGNCSLVTTDSAYAHTGTTTYRPVQYIKTNADGTRLFVIQNTYPSTVLHREQENPWVFTNLVFNPAGVLTSTPSNWKVDTQGRVSTSVAFDSSQGSLFYGLGTGNENNKVVKRASLVPSGASLPAPVSIGTSARYEVLHAGR